MWQIILCIAVVFYISKILHYSIEMWQTLDLKEEKSVPIYITKEL